MTLTGAQEQAKVATQALAADPKILQALYAEEVAAYLEAVALQPASPEALKAAVDAVQNLDPGRPVVLDARPIAADPAEMLADAARDSTLGIDLTLFQAPALETARLVPMLSPLVLLAREFTGDLSWDPGSSPSGAEGAWTFVRGKDLGLRVIALATGGSPGSDAPLQRAGAPPAGTVPDRRPAGAAAQRRGGRRRAGAAGGLARTGGRARPRPPDGRRAPGGRGEGHRLLPARDPGQEILRRLQAFEDAQNRRLEHYSATNTTSLRFQPAAETQAIEATLQGPFFFDPKTGTDWAWETLYVNGVKWRGKTLPEIPLIQPEKAAAPPLEIHFTKEYRYRLRGSDTIDGREAWVVDFTPAGPDASGKLYQGSVWIDKKLYSRLRTRAVQVGLEGEVLSNEETLFYSPVDASGQAAPWSAQSYMLPLRLVAQQILSVINAATIVERETRLTDVQINGPGFEEARKRVNASDATMVRDTPKGLRYLVKDAQGERVVKEGFKASKLFGAGGLFYDDALDYPLPLAGINYFSFNYRGTGKQVNVFFGGALLTANIAEPRLFGSRFDAGANAFAIAIPLTDTIYRNGKEIKDEAVEQRPATFSLRLGHPLGNFVKIGAEYEALYFHFGKADDTANGFVVPSSNITHSFSLNTDFARSGYRLSASGSYNRRSPWDFWGLPGNPDFSEAKRDFLRWDASASKNWYLPRFQKVGLEVDYAGGSDLDRFSKYQFGFFGGTRVHGYQSNSVRADRVFAGHASYGFEIGQAFRLDAVADAALATDPESGLKNEFLGGVGLAGTFIGPWQTVVNLDVGTPVAGPDSGFVLYVVFLKLFK